MFAGQNRLWHLASSPARLLFNIGPCGCHTNWPAMVIAQRWSISTTGGEALLGKSGQRGEHLGSRTYGSSFFARLEDVARRLLTRRKPTFHFIKGHSGEATWASGERWSISAGRATRRRWVSKVGQAASAIEPVHNRVGSDRDEAISLLSGGAKWPPPSSLSRDARATRVSRGPARAVWRTLIWRSVLLAWETGRKSDKASADRPTLHSSKSRARDEFSIRLRFTHNSWLSFGFCRSYSCHVTWYSELMEQRSLVDYDS